MQEGQVVGVVGELHLLRVAQLAVESLGDDGGERREVLGRLEVPQRAGGVADEQSGAGKAVIRHGEYEFAASVRGQAVVADAVAAAGVDERVDVRLLTALLDRGGCDVFAVVVAAAVVDGLRATFVGLAASVQREIVSEKVDGIDDLENGGEVERDFFGALTKELLLLLNVRCR